VNSGYGKWEKDLLLYTHRSIALGSDRGADRGKGVDRIDLSRILWLQKLTISFSEGSKMGLELTARR